EKYLDQLRDSVQNMHRDVADQRLKQRLLNQKRKRGENLVNFDVGDFVLRSRVDERHGNKLQVTWVGPYRVVRADAHSFAVQHLVTGDELDVHSSRLKFYADDSLEGILLAVESLKEHKWNADISDFEILVGWKGLQSIEDSYEPMQNLAKDIRVLLGNYVDKANDQQLTEYWSKLCGDRTQETVAPVTVPVDSTTTTTTSDELRASLVDAGSSRRRLTGRKRNRRPMRKTASGQSQQSANDNAEAMEVTLGATQRQVRLTEASERRVDVVTNSSLSSLGLRTRSMTGAAAVSTTTAKVPMRTSAHDERPPRRSCRRRS
ncbi:hypothetical protein PHMEG_00034631, partial [Phytophthora megakarya]